MVLLLGIQDGLPIANQQKQMLLFLYLSMSVYAGVMNLSKEKANEMIKQRAKFFTKVFLVPYNTKTLSRF